MSLQAINTANGLRRRAFIGLAVSVLLLAIAPFLRSGHDLAFWLIWPLLLASVLIALGIAAHLLFDAALFRLIATNREEKTALAEVDSILERMSLRARQSTLRPLADRVAGSRRIVSRLYLFLGLGIILSILLAILPPFLPVGAEF